MSARVGLIVTGQCEKKGLGHSLARVFPEVQFELLDRVESFTSADVRETPSSSEPGTTLDKFAASIVAAVEEEPPDLVVAIDDLELVNAPHPELVVSRVRDAVHAHLARHSWTSEATRVKVTQRVRERCSFHLLAPMVEAYFFAEPAALVRAGASRPSGVDAAAIDLEAFVTDDPGFLNHPFARHKQNPKQKSWAIPMPDRARHPKHYLRFLCDPMNPYTDRYVETKGGAEALRELDWARVFANRERVRLARSLFEDISERLGMPHPFPGTGHPAMASFKTARVLRNL
ncbi:hypothetical protein [Vitiosangium sp. GDMCC 1.1324]|uniref:hypothetical protein n=1 Tax=Vitiosangium sp. (strain GDMCC 1.1324) TaxID=2138576 RepID=UPI000D381B24|nr:hypothetical protein [Vitiosangium sp. GDMCC 1.1324]PTL83029.1 hypothetical protein DAT35_13495 [Vitiosangium sp. GDMCC 1.1324]